jgi:orotate phosphoribosyltransferase
MCGAKLMKTLESLVKKALEYKEKGLSEKEISDELHLSVDTVVWLLTKGKAAEQPPVDVKIGWRSIGVFGTRIGNLASILVNIAHEELAKQNESCDAIVGIAINGIPLATLMSEQMEKELIIYRPSTERYGAGAFGSNYASVDGKKVIVVDDVLSTGDTIRNAINDVLERDGKPLVAMVLVNKTDMNDIDGVPLRALVRARAIA